MSSSSPAPENDDSAGWRDVFREFAAYGHLGMMFPVSIGLGLLFGYLLDGWLGTGPWLALGGFVLGVAAGIVNIFRTMAAEERREQRERRARIDARRRARRRDDRGGSHEETGEGR